MSLDPDFQTFTAAMNTLLPIVVNFMLLPLGAVIAAMIGEIILNAMDDFFHQVD